MVTVVRVVWYWLVTQCFVWYTVCVVTVLCVVYGGLCGNCGLCGIAMVGVVTGLVVLQCGNSSMICVAIVVCVVLQWFVWYSSLCGSSCLCGIQWFACCLSCWYGITVTTSFALDVLHEIVCTGTL